MDSITLLTAVSDIDGKPSNKKMNKFVYSSGQSEFDAKHKWFSVETHDLCELVDLFTLLKHQTRETRKSIVRGAYSGASPNFTARQNTHFKSVQHHWVCLDIDNVGAPIGVDPTSLEAVEVVVQTLPKDFHEADYIVHFSSSAGTKGQLVKVHIWFWLENPLNDDSLKRWAKSTDGLVDHSLFQKVHHHFICDPEFENSEMDLFINKPRLNYIKKSRETVPIAFLKNTPAPSYISLRRGGGIPQTKMGTDPTIIRDQNGMAIEGRENLHLKIRFHLMQIGYTDFEKFCTDVWESFSAQAKLGPTEISDTDWNLALSNQKCLQDKDKLALYVGGNVIIPRTYLDRDEAQKRLSDTISNYFADEKTTAIKAAAGLGKSKGVREAIALLPNPSIEYYVPTRALANECANDFDTSLNVRVFEGRHEGNCQKFELATKIGKFGGGVLKKLCNNQSGKSCEYWGTCGWSVQNPDNKPGIRIMAHANLNLERPDHFPKPDAVIVDESILSQILNEWKHPANRIWSMTNIDPVSLYIRGSGPVTKKYPNKEITSNEGWDLFEIGKIIQTAHVSKFPLLHELRSQGYTRDDLLRCSAVAKAFTPYLKLDPDMSSDQMINKMEEGKRRGIKSIQWLSKFYKLLALEIDFDRDEPRGIQFVGEDCILMYRNDLPRLKDVPVLFLDADLEPTILASIKDKISIINLDVRYNADIYKVTDRAFSKSELGLVNDKIDAEKIAEIDGFISALPKPEKTLVITYIELQEELTGERQGFSKMDCGATVGHFGNIRGIDAYKDFDTAVVIGRNKPPTYVIDQKLRALTHDINQADNGELSSAIYRAMVTSETNQAVARLRMIWCDYPKTVYLLSNENVPFAAQHELRWEELQAGGSRLQKLINRFEAFPLIPKWLFENASDLFDTKKSAEKWIENNFPVGTETGMIRIKEVGGPKPSRFVAGDQVLDPLSKLEENLGKRLTKYAGPERGFLLRKKMMRELTRHHDIQPLIDMGIVLGPRLPEP